MTPKRLFYTVLISAALAVLAWAWYWSRADEDGGGITLFRPRPKKMQNNPQPVTAPVKVQDISAQLPSNGRYPARSLADIAQVVVHHSATDSAAPGSNPKAYAAYHVKTRRWPGIGYHYVIQNDGTVYQTQPLDVKSNHVQNANGISIGICLSGNFDKENPTPAALGALTGLIRLLNAQLGRSLKIKAHNEYAPKSCPGAGVNVAEIAAWIYGPAA